MHACIFILHMYKFIKSLVNAIGQVESGPALGDWDQLAKALAEDEQTKDLNHRALENQNQNCS